METISQAICQFWGLNLLEKFRVGLSEILLFHTDL